MAQQGSSLNLVCVLKNKNHTPFAFQERAGSRAQVEHGQFDIGGCDDPAGDERPLAVDGRPEVRGGLGARHQSHPLAAKAQRPRPHIHQCRHWQVPNILLPIHLHPIFQCSHICPQPHLAFLCRSVPTAVGDHDGRPWRLLLRVPDQAVGPDGQDRRLPQVRLCREHGGRAAAAVQADGAQQPPLHRRAPLGRQPVQAQDGRARLLPARQRGARCPSRGVAQVTGEKEQLHLIEFCNCKSYFTICSSHGRRRWRTRAT